MPARPWADEPRQAYLKAQLPSYEAAKERKRTRQFLSILHEGYFARFPQTNENLLFEEKKRVSAWMNNHSGGRGKGLGALSRATRVNFRELLRGKLDEKRRQKLQATQAYSELYWKSKLKVIIQADWQKKLEDEPEMPKKNYLAFMNMRVREIYETEPDDVKAEVEHYRSAQPQDTDSASMLLPEEEKLAENEKTRRIAAREVQSAIDNVEVILTTVVKDIEEVTGLKAHFMLSGPEPKRDGKMVFFTISSGRTVTGNQSFRDLSTYKQDVHDKFLAFAKGCYTREDRERYANVPFDSESSPNAVLSSNSPAPTSVSAPHASRNPTVRKRARKAKTDTSSDSDSDSCDNDNDLDPSGLDTPRDTVSDGEEYDDMDIFSPLLPPDRRVVETKDSADGLTLYKTAKGEWLSETELERLANMSRNARLMKELGIEEARQCLTARPKNDKEPEPDDEREFSTASIRAAPTPRERHPRRSKQNVSYTEKKDDGLDLGVESIPVPAPGDPVEPVSDTLQPVATGNASEPEPVYGHGGVPQVSVGNVTVANAAQSVLPVAPNSRRDSVSSSTDTAVVPSQFSPSPPTLLATNVDSLGSPLSGDVVMEVDNDTGLAMPMEVDNHASLDDSPPGSSVDASPRKSIRSVVLDTLEFSKVPAWLQEPLKYLRKNFRGELEDEVLGAFVALEMAWQPLEKRIGTISRPNAVAWWIKHARPIDRVPPCVDLASFPGEVRAWWSTIQPQWRVPVIEDWPLPQQIPDGESWQEARLGGSNGLFLVILCLYWWRKSAEEEFDKVALAEYAAVAEDVAFVFEAILSSGVSQQSLSPLTGSARANAQSAKRKATKQGSAVLSRSLRSSGAKENVKPSRARRSRS